MPRRRGLWYASSMKTTPSLAVAALLGLLGATGCGASTATPDDLAHAVVGFLAAGDFDGYLADTVVTTQQGLEVCPGAKSFSLNVSSFRDHFVSCGKAFAFADASVTTVSPSLEIVAAGDKSCGNAKAINTANSIKVTVTGAAGTYDFQIDDSVETAAGWRQLKHLRCAGPTPNCDKFLADTQACCSKAMTADGQSSCQAVLDTISAAAAAAAQLETDCNPVQVDCSSYP